MIISNINVSVDRDKCVACGTCVDRCIMDNLRLSVAPCRQACPLSLNCQGYTRYLAKDKGKEGALELRKHTPFGGILGRICTQPCESSCERKTQMQDGAVHLRAIKRYLTEAFPEELATLTEKKPDTGKTIAIIGSGPAGLMAAHELAAEGNTVTIYEAADEPGGLLRYGIPEFRLPKKILDQALEQVTGLGVKIVTGKKLGQDIMLDDLRKQNDAVLLAIGLGKPIRPQTAVNISAAFDALDLLREVRQGKFSTSVKSATIIGGGMTAMDVALTLRKLGIEVTIVALEAARDMPVSDDDRIEAKEEGVLIKDRWGLKEMRAEGTKFALTLQRCLSVFDAEGCFAPEMDPLLMQEHSTEMLVFATGQGLENCELPCTKCMLVSQNIETGQLEGFENVFVAGDCTLGSSSVANAMASGLAVARCLHRFLGAAYPLALDYWAEHGMIREYESVPERSNRVPRGALTRMPAGKRSIQAEVELTFTKEQADKEAKRCMSCGRAFEMNKTCWFCLPCEIDCPEEALTIRMPYQIR